MVALRQLPAVLLLSLVSLLVFFQLVAFCVFKWRSRGGAPPGSEKQLCGPWQIWVDRMLTAYPLLALLLGTALPVGFGVAGIYSSNFRLDVNLDFSTYLAAELEERYLFDLATALGREQMERTENLQDRGKERWASWNFVSASLASDASTSRRAQAMRPQVVNFWKLDIFYQAKDPEKGIFTREALEEIRDFEGRLLSFPGYADFCRMRFSTEKCDPHYSATNVFFSVPDALETTGDEMQVIYDGSGTLANIDDVLEGFLRDGLDWWVDKDFGPLNMKSQYTRASFFGGLPLPGYPDLSTRQAEQREKSADFLRKLWTDLLHRSDEGEDGLNYEHVIISWYERRYLTDFEVTYYLISDCWFCLGTMITVVSMVLFRTQNLFTTFFGIISVALAFVATYYFHYVVMGYQRLTVMDLISIFLIIAIAADNILLLYNTYHLAPAMMAAEKDELSPAERMRWAYRKASLAMLVTSATTCGSFYANMLSIVTVVRGFGFFMGTLVLWNFVNVLTIFAASILVSETYLVPCLPKRCRASPSDEGDPVIPRPGRSRGGLSSASTQQVSQDPSSMFTVDSQIIKLGCIERLMDRRFRPCLVRGRWLLLLISLSLSGLSIYLAFVGFRVASGDIVVFESDLNLGRMQALISEVFPSYAATDLNTALAIVNPLSPTTVPSCARLGDNSTWCSGQGWCNTFIGRCTCEEMWVGTGCSVPRKNSSLQLIGSYEFLHIFARPSLIESVASLDFTTTMYLINDGDQLLEWSLSVPVSSRDWMGVVPSIGVVPQRSFSADDQQIFDGQGSFVLKYFTGSKPAGFNESVYGILDVKNLGTQTVRFSAMLMQPPALAALAIELVDLNVSAPLTPPFALDFGFSLDDDTLNLALPGLAPKPWYNASVAFDVERIAVKTELFGTASAVEVNGERSTGGLSQPIALDFVEPESNEIWIRVFSAFTDQVLPTVYKLEVFRDPPPTTTVTSTTVTSVTRTTTKSLTLVAGDMSIQVSDCALLSTEEQRLVAGLASMLSLPVDTVQVDVRCSRRLGEGSRALASSAALRYELRVPDADLPTVLTTLDATSSAALTSALQSALDQGTSGVALTVTELLVDGVTRTSTSTGPSTTVLTETSSTVTVVTSTATTVTATTSTGTTVTVTSSTQSSVTQTSSTATSVTETLVTHTATSITVTTATRVTSTTSSTGDYVLLGSIGMDVSDCDALNAPSGLEALRRAIAEAAGVDPSEVQIEVQCRSRRRLSARAAKVEWHESNARRLQWTSATVSFEINPQSVNVVQANLAAETSASLEQKIQAALTSSSAPPTSLSVTEISEATVDIWRSSTTSSITSSTRGVQCPGSPVCGGLAGECVAVDASAGLWECECSETYAGSACDLRTCPSCQNNGSCVPGDQSPSSAWTCECPTGFEGFFCQQLSCPKDCSNSGDCDLRTGSCSCFPGYSGDDCAVTPNWKVPLENAIEIHLTWGLKGHQAYNTSAPDFNSGFDLFANETQAWLLNTCRLARATPELLVRPELRCWIEDFQRFVNLAGGVFPVRDPELASQALQAWMHRDDAKEFYGDVSTVGTDYDGRANFAQVRFKVNVARTDNTTYRKMIRQQWESFVAARNNGSAPASVGVMLMVSGTWVQMEMENQVVASTFTAFLGSVTVSLLAVALFTQNVIIALYVCLNILLVVCILAGFLLNIMGYEFGVAEAIGATIFVGLSVDYCLHLAHAYNSSPGNTSRMKMRHTLLVIGPSILGGAATTVAGTAFLLPCRILLFQKLGWSLFANALVSILLTFSFLCPMLILLGPTGRQGDLCPCLRRSLSKATSRYVSDRTDPNEVVLDMAPETTESTFHLDAAISDGASDTSRGPPQMEVERRNSGQTEGTFDTDIISVTDRPDGHRF